MNITSSLEWRRCSLHGHGVLADAPLDSRPAGAVIKSGKQLGMSRWLWSLRWLACLSLWSRLHFTKGKCTGAAECVTKPTSWTHLIFFVGQLPKCIHQLNWVYLHASHAPWRSCHCQSGAQHRHVMARRHTSIVSVKRLLHIATTPIIREFVISMHEFLSLLMCSHSQLGHHGHFLVFWLAHKSYSIYLLLRIILIVSSHRQW